jgi:hypothetical protein
VIGYGVEVICEGLEDLSFRVGSFHEEVMVEDTDGDWLGSCFSLS